VTRLTTCADPEAVAERAAAEVVRHLQMTREQRRAVHVALSGGRTPKRAYELLGHAPEEWAGVEVWFADERCVAPEDEQSNYRLVAESLIDPAGIAPERVHRMEGELGPEEGARRYADALRANVPGESSRADGPGPPAFDLILLGIGEDGHVASLFPEAATLSADQASVCLGVRHSPKPPPERITLSLPVLRAAGRCLLLATGAEKADALAAMLAEPSQHVPASLLRRGRLTVIVDDAAAPARRHDVS
jgi:6-phosphogluconolactonase